MAAAESPDRYLRFHRRNPCRAAGRDGRDHSLRAGRTIRGVRRHFRDQRATAESGSGQFNGEL